MTNTQYHFESAQVSKNDIIRKFYEAGCIQFGSYKLKSGLECPYYIDMRELSMMPGLFDTIADHLANMIKSKGQDQKNGLKSIHGDNAKKVMTIVGVPYGAVPLASLISNKLMSPYYPMRKEAKGYGRLISANKYAETNYFVLIEDVISSGASIEDAIEKLPEGSVKKICVIVDRQQGGVEMLKKKYPDVLVYTLTTITEILNTLGECGLIETGIRDSSLEWLGKNRNSR